MNGNGREELLRNGINHLTFYSFPLQSERMKLLQYLTITNTQTQENISLEVSH